MRRFIWFFLFHLLSVASVATAQEYVLNESDILKSSGEMETILRDEYAKQISDFDPDDLQVTIGEAIKISLLGNETIIRAAVEWAYDATYKGKELHCLGYSMDLPSGRVCLINQQITIGLRGDTMNPPEKAESAGT